MVQLAGAATTLQTTKHPLTAMRKVNVTMKSIVRGAAPASSAKVGGVSGRFLVVAAGPATAIASGRPSVVHRHGSGAMGVSSRVPILALVITQASEAFPSRIIPILRSPLSRGAGVRHSQCQIGVPGVSSGIACGMKPGVRAPGGRPQVLVV